MERTSINLGEVGNKARSKWELYLLLTVEGGLYLPSENQTKMEFISDIFFNEKKVNKDLVFVMILFVKVLHSSDIKVFQIPHNAGLRSNDLIEFIMEDYEREEFPKKVCRLYFEQNMVYKYIKNIY